MDFTALAPQRGTGLTRRSTGREAGPNPFLDNGWLKESYDLHMANGPEGSDFEVTVPGTWEDAVKTRGKSKGQPYMKLVGDAATVVRMLRDAADKLEIGVAIECVQATKPGRRKGETTEVPGMVTVKYLAKERKVYAPREGTSDADTNGEDENEYPDTGDDDE